MENKPISDAELAELRGLRERIQRFTSSDEEQSAALSFVDAFPGLLARIEDLQAYRDEVEAAKPTVQALLDSGERAASEAADLRQRLEAAEREREELRQWRELHKDNTDCPDCNGTAIGCETCTESGLVGIYQRDAQQRREGAIEALKSLKGMALWDGDPADMDHAVDLAAKRLREGGE